MRNIISETVTPTLAELSRKTGLILRPVDSATVNNLFAELEKYDSQERAKTFNYLKSALNETRASLRANLLTRMSKLILLDSGPLGIISNPSQSETVVTCREWAQSHLEQGNVSVVPEIADYEVCRELLRADKASGIQRLDLINNTLAYLPITTAVMLRAAEFWAQARKA